MQEFFKSPIVRSILAFVALILVSLAIWFIGPLLSFNELRPLASITVRVTFIIFMLVLVIFWLMEWNLTAIGVAALCLLVWHASPLLAFAGTRTFESVWSRVVAISLIFLIFTICVDLYAIYFSLLFSIFFEFLRHAFWRKQ